MRKNLFHFRERNPLRWLSHSTNNSLRLPRCDFKPNNYKSKMNLNEIELNRHKYLNPCLKVLYKKPILLTQGHMQYVWDSEGQRYLDMFGGIVTTSIGHCHPRLVETVQRQSEKLWHVSSLYLTEEINEYSRKLASYFPEPLNCLFFCNSGSEANDIAITMARLHTKAFDVIALRNGYHGSTLSTMPLCGLGVWKFPFPNSFGFTHVTNPDPYRGRVGGLHCRDSLVQTNRACDCKDSENCRAAEYYAEEFEIVLESTLPKTIAAFFAESIQGVRIYLFVSDDDTIIELIVKQRGGLIVMDEVQTGFGRTGNNFWGFRSHDIIPDIVTMAKGIGNGFPMAAVITTQEIANTLTLASYFNTFGGNPMASAIGSTVLDIIESEKLQHKSKQLGSFLMKNLARLRNQYQDIVGDVRGQGLMIGVEMMLNGKSMPKNHIDFILEEFKNMQLIIGKGGAQANVFRITPPMCINEEDIEFTIAVIEQAFKNYREWARKEENQS
ncbi:hypothetical protein SSS_09615 [Sarcoptes scabiei]|nr:hypothetical protein SSS_09615 [Sarcoptes scabiei]